MGIEKKLDAFELLDKAGLCTNLSSYSGRGASYHDLTPRILARLHADVMKNYGDAAAKNLSTMITALPELRADDFIKGYVILADSGWEWAEEMNYGLPSKPTTREIPRRDAEVTVMIKSEFLRIIEKK